MAGKSDYLANKELEHSFGRTAYTMPAVVAAALVTVVPSKTDSGATITEATYTNYARLVLTPGTDLAAAVAGLTQNATLWAWPPCGGGSSNVVAVVILDSATIGAGNMLRWGAASFFVTTGATPQIQPGAAVFGES